ncbi:MAG TPA: ACT domain-containing protein [Candidatus Avilachnospira avicola]|nr:ACT domain-containing protein [Candidatus Avilachnospira avicola]
MNRAIITVVGKDTVGIIAGICTYLAEHNINILDISQTILQGIFNMMMIVDVSASDISFDELSDGLYAVGEEKHVDVKCQREEIFTSMHRI